MKNSVFIDLGFFNQGEKTYVFNREIWLSYGNNIRDKLLFIAECFYTVCLIGISGGDL